MTVYDDIRAERQRQDVKWGGPEHDDRHLVGDWVGLLDDRVHLLYSDNEAGPGYRRRLVQVAALAVAAVEAFDRVGRLS
jgi:hypothetical protein